MEWSWVSTITSWIPTPLIVRLERSTLRVGSPSRDNAANLLGRTLTRQFPSPPFMRRISPGDICSFPGQNGQVGEYDGRGFTSRFVFSSSGRLARSVAITTHSLVKRFWRISGMAFSQAGEHTKVPSKVHPEHRFCVGAKISARINSFHGRQKDPRWNFGRDRSCRSAL